VRGACRDCTTLGCPAGELCSARTCVADRCGPGTCAADEGCFDGTCRALCDDRTCPRGTACDATGACTASSCAGVTCPTGLVCESGACRDDVCTRADCDTGSVCIPGRGCTPDPCALAECPAGRVCTISARGDAQCFVAGDAGLPDPPDFVAATGGGGACSATAVGAPRGHGAWLALGVLALLARHARRRPRRDAKGVR
jgi:hypothetical protein